MDFIQASVLFYAKRMKLRVRSEDIVPIGLPLQAYFPALGAAIETGGYGEDGGGRKNLNLHRELMKNALCRKYGILLIRIIRESEAAYNDGSCPCILIDGETTENVREALFIAFNAIGMEPDIDLSRDRNAILELMHETECFD